MVPTTMPRESSRRQDLLCWWFWCSVDPFVRCSQKGNKTRVDSLHLLATSSNYQNKLSLMASWTEMGGEVKEMLPIWRSQGEASQNEKKKSSPGPLLTLWKPSIMSEGGCFGSLGLPKQKYYKPGGFRKKWLPLSFGGQIDVQGQGSAGLTSEDIYSWLESRNFTSLSSHSLLSVPICGLVSSYKNIIHIGLWSIHMISSLLCYLLKDPIS